MESLYLYNLPTNLVLPPFVKVVLTPTDTCMSPSLLLSIQKQGYSKNNQKVSKLRTRHLATGRVTYTNHLYEFFFRLQQRLNVRLHLLFSHKSSSIYLSHQNITSLFFNLHYSYSFPLTFWSLFWFPLKCTGERERVDDNECRGLEFTLAPSSLWVPLSLVTGD